MTADPYTVIRGGRILDWVRCRAEPADILLRGDTIEEVGPPGLPSPYDALLVPADDQLLVPGLVNSHTHSHGGLAKGLVEDRVPLEMFLTAGPALNGGRFPEEKYLSTLLSAAEMVRKGCTTCYDLVVELPTPSEQGIHAVAQAYCDIGMRAVVAPMMADRTLYEAIPGLLDAMPDLLREDARKISMAPYETSIDACKKILTDWSFDCERVRPALGPTIPLHCSDDFLRACRDLSAEFCVPLQTHLAETKTQAISAIARYGKSLVVHLDSLGLLNDRMSVAHAIWIADEDIKRLADAGVKVAHNPLSNLRIGSGVAPVRLMLDHGVEVGIGTDATNTSDGQNMFEATRLAAYLSRIVTPNYHQWLSVSEAFSLATTGSARVLGFADRVGRLKKDFKADIVFLNLDHINYIPLGNPATQLVNVENGMAVDSVMISGQFVLRGGRILTVDEAKLRRDAESALERLVAANLGIKSFGRKVEEIVGLFCLGLARSHYSVHRTLRERDYLC